MFEATLAIQRERKIDLLMGLHGLEEARVESGPFFQRRLRRAAIEAAKEAIQRDLAEQLDRIRIGGFGLGFWFAQQGSIYVFVILIFVYVWLMNRLDSKYELDEEEHGE